MRGVREEMAEESLADVVRRRRAREPVEDTRGVNALLSKLRIEQERQRENMVFRAARNLVKDDETRTRYLYGTSTAQPGTHSFHTDQIDPTAHSSTPSARTTRRRTPGPLAPASWTGTTSSSLRPPAPAARLLAETEEGRRRLYEGWCDFVLEEFIGADQMPWELRRSRRSRERCGSDNAAAARGGSVGGETKGVAPLVDITYSLLARYMDPVDDTPSWLASPDVKQFLGTRARMTVMVNGVWNRSTTWRGVRDLAVGEEAEERDEEAEEEPEEWDAVSEASDRPSHDKPPLHLPILDFSFTRLDSAPASRPGSSRAAQERRGLTRYLSTPTVHRSVQAISFAGASMTFRQAVETLTGGGPWGALRAVSLAGLREERGEDLGVALGKLARCCGGLGILDLTGIQLFPHEGWSWRTFLTTLLGRRPNGKYHYPSLRVLWLRDCYTPGEGQRTGGGGITGKQPRGSVDGQGLADGFEEYEAEVKRLVRSLGRPRWVDVVVR